MSRGDERDKASGIRSAPPEPDSAEGRRRRPGAPDLPGELPVLPLRGTVLFPGATLPILVGRTAPTRPAWEELQPDRLIAVTAIRDPERQEPGPGDLHSVGTAARLLDVRRLPNGSLNLIVRGLHRVRLDRWSGPDPYLRARVRLAAVEPVADDVEVEALRVTARRLVGDLGALTTASPTELESLFDEELGPDELADGLATGLGLPVDEGQRILEISAARERLQEVVALLGRRLQLHELSRKIDSEARGEIDRSQREIYLRERLRAIRRELGEFDDETAEVEELGRRIDEAGLPEEARRAAEEELARLARMSPASAEIGVSRTYLEWLLDVPWNRATDDRLDVAAARRILDEDHYDLDKVKERILEYLAVRRLKADMKGPILCFIGPPGVGKTSLGRSIARALGREFVRVSLGGIHDEAEIRGHRRTYVGALPGRIVQGLKRAGTINPVFMLDEIDKVGADFRGDPSAALLEVLDPEQNGAFSDHYLEVPVDLSRVLFITTGNVPENVPDALYDRLEILEIPGYTAEEKVQIAQRFLLPRQLGEHGLPGDRLRFDDEAILAIVRDYTDEAGVRELERRIAAIARATARRVAEALDGSGEDPEASRPEEIGPDRLHAFLGPVQYFNEVAEQTAVPGVATALAWTASGGDILFVEATRMRGKGDLHLTGQLGDVMKESAQAAHSYLRSRATSWGIDPEIFDSLDVHVHVPAGSIPKDGPSAGVAVLTALTSLFSGRPVRSDTGMTGEITLRGRLMPVGGIKNKVLAARRAGLARVLLPSKNEKDLEEIPEEVRRGLEFLFVDGVDEALEAALEPQPGERAAGVVAEPAPETGSGASGSGEPGSDTAGR